MLVFVYGSLKRGYSLHHLLYDQEFMGTALTKPLYCLFDLGSYPGIVDWPIGKSIAGELYRVTAERLSILDHAEGVAEGHYARRNIQLDAASHQLVKTSDSIHAWFWLGNVAALSECGPSWAP